MMLADLHATACIVDGRGVSMCAERIHEGAGCCLNGFFRASCRHNVLKDGGDAIARKLPYRFVATSVPKGGDGECGQRVVIVTKVGTTFVCKPEGFCWSAAATATTWMRACGDDFRQFVFNQVVKVSSHTCGRQAQVVTNIGGAEGTVFEQEEHDLSPSFTVGRPCFGLCCHAFYLLTQMSSQGSYAVNRQPILHNTSVL